MENSFSHPIVKRAHDIIISVLFEIIKPLALENVSIYLSEYVAFDEKKAKRTTREGKNDF